MASFWGQNRGQLGKIVDNERIEPVTPTMSIFSLCSYDLHRILVQEGQYARQRTKQNVVL